MMTLGSARAFFAMGMRPWHRMTSFVGRAEVPSRVPKWYERLGVWRGRDLSSWDDPGAWTAALREWRPQTLVGYAMTLRILAETMRDGSPIGWRPRVVISGSGVLDEFTRRFLESTFACPIMDYYASYESGTIAWECRRCGGYHISADTVIVETLQDGQPVPAGRPGEVVVTNLHSYAMPFIRYRQGDEAVLSPRRPVCGRTLPLMEKIQGRADDVVVLSDGRKIPSHPFYYAIEPVRGVKRWKVVQESLQVLRISIEPGPGFDEDSRRRIEHGLRAVVGEAMRIEFAIGPSLPISASQKHRQVSSRIAGADRD
jgi:phenylacetate-CoA ligase